MREKPFGPIMFLLIGVYALSGLWLLGPGVAQDASKCAAKKLRAAGKYNNCLVRAEARAAARAQELDAERVATCNTRLTERWNAAESLGAGCPTFDDREDIRSLFTSLSGDLAAALTGQGELPTCGPRVTTTTICFTGFVSTTFTTTTTRIEECRNGIFDPDIGETDVDCGGAACRGCGAGSPCDVPGDCDSFVCIGDVCQAPTCDDGLRNGKETASDCGGGGCPGCPDGSLCFDCTDCTSRACDENRCQPRP